ncbi:MAG: hypothetical protein U0Y10_03115 [Spirosomataceae bacterium]
MTTGNLLRLLATFALYVFLQIFFVRNLVLFDFAFCYIYIGVILLLPFETTTITLLLVGFGTGLLVDIFYNTLGMHAAATTLMAYLRPLIIRLLAPQRGYEERMTLSVRSMGMRWFVAYIAILTFVHHLLLFYVEASNIALFFPTLLKVIASTLFSSLVLVALQYLRRE